MDQRTLKASALSYLVGWLVVHIPPYSNSVTLKIEEARSSEMS